MTGAGFDRYPAEIGELGYGRFTTEAAVSAGFDSAEGHSPVIGLRRSKVFPPLAGVCFAPIKSCVFMTLILRSAMKRFRIYYPECQSAGRSFLLATYRHIIQ